MLPATLIIHNISILHNSCFWSFHRNIFNCIFFFGYLRGGAFHFFLTFTVNIFFFTFRIPVWSQTVVRCLRWKYWKRCKLNWGRWWDVFLKKKIMQTLKYGRVEIVHNWLGHSLTGVWVSKAKACFLQNVTLCVKYSCCMRVCGVGRLIHVWLVCFSLHTPF